MPVGGLMANPEKARASGSYYKANPEKGRAGNRAYRKANPEQNDVLGIVPTRADTLRDPAQ